MGVVITVFKKIWLAVLLSFVFAPMVTAQTFFKEISLEEQVDEASLVVEGKVISRKSFFGDGNTIYTSNTVEVYKVFKGDPVSEVQVVTVGGTVGLESQVVTHSLQLKVGYTGIFMLIQDSASTLKSGSSKVNLFTAYSGFQGFYKYNSQHVGASNSVFSKSEVSNPFYNKIEALTKSDYIEVKTLTVENETSKLSEVKSSLAPESIVFSPTHVSAGTGSTIVISIPNGSTGDFGNTQGMVSFRNADSGGVDALGFADFVDVLDTQILNWSATSITVEVPSLAGTGNIRVTDANGNIVDSSVDLNIDYALLNVEFDVDFGDGEKTYAFPTRLLDNDGSGGYVFHMEASFDADIEQAGAKGNFISALDTWRCETGVNFSIGAVTSIDEISADNVNVIRFDNGDELPAGTGGRTSYYYRGCGVGSGVEVFPVEIDMIFNDDASWFFGTGSSVNKYDFQSVVLHELGHAHQLSHVINDVDGVMHYETKLNNPLRTLSENDILAANSIMDESDSGFPDSDCFDGRSIMSVYNNCVLGVGQDHVDGDIKIFPNPTKGKLYIKTSVLDSLEQVLVFDIGGRLVLKKSFYEASTDNSIDLSFVQKGVYFVKTINNKGVIVRKIVVK